MEDEKIWVKGVLWFSSHIYTAALMPYGKIDREARHFQIPLLKPGSQGLWPLTGTWAQGYFLASPSFLYLLPEPHKIIVFDLHHSWLLAYSFFLTLEEPQAAFLRFIEDISSITPGTWKRSMRPWKSEENPPPGPKLPNLFLLFRFLQQPGTLVTSLHHLLYSWPIIFPFPHLRHLEETKESWALSWGRKEMRIPIVTENSLRFMFIFK